MTSVSHIQSEETKNLKGVKALLTWKNLKGIVCSHVAWSLIREKLYLEAKMQGAPPW